MKLIKNENCKIFAQLSKAQANFNEVVKDKEAKSGITKNGKSFGGYKYADISQVLNAITPSLNDNGLFLSQFPYIEENKFTLTTFVSNEDGDILELGSISYRIDGLTPQELGSVITYLRRYCLLSCFGLGTEDDDASSVNKKLTEEADKTLKLNQSPPKTSQKQNISEEELNFILKVIKEVKSSDDLKAVGKELIAPLSPELQQKIRPSYSSRMVQLKSNTLAPSNSTAANVTSNTVN